MYTIRKRNDSTTLRWLLYLCTLSTLTFLNNVLKIENLGTTVLLGSTVLQDTNNTMQQDIEVVVIPSQCEENVMSDWAQTTLENGDYPQYSQLSDFLRGACFNRSTSRFGHLRISVH
jgi:hypothetical protein